jgi:hypothetical protein
LREEHNMLIRGKVSAMAGRAIARQFAKMEHNHNRAEGLPLLTIPRGPNADSDSLVVLKAQDLRALLVIAESAQERANTR